MHRSRQRIIGEIDDKLRRSTDIDEGVLDPPVGPLIEREHAERRVLAEHVEEGKRRRVFVCGEVSRVMLHELEHPCPPTIISKSGLNVCFWHKRTSQPSRQMSAIGGKADMTRTCADVRF